MTWLKRMRKPMTTTAMMTSSPCNIEDLEDGEGPTSLSTATGTSSGKPADKVNMSRKKPTPPSPESPANGSWRWPQTIRHDPRRGLRQACHLRMDRRGANRARQRTIGQPRHTRASAKRANDQGDRPPPPEATKQTLRRVVVQSTALFAFLICFAAPVGLGKATDWRVSHGRTTARNPRTRIILLADAQYPKAHGHEYDAIHASPPRQAYTKAGKQWRKEGRECDMIAATREALERTGKPWVIENRPRRTTAKPGDAMGQPRNQGAGRDTLKPASRLNNRKSRQ